MADTDSPPWLQWVQTLQSIAHNGLTFATDRYDIERYERVREVAAAITSNRTGAQMPAVVEAFKTTDFGYITPKVDVRGAIFHGDKVLLVWEPQECGWALPGGWAELHETPAEAIVREVREECGIQVRASRLLAVWDKSRHEHPASLLRVYKVIFECNAKDGHVQGVGGEPRAAYFPIEELPQLSVDRITHRQLKRLHELHLDPTTPADFD
ncbi:MAG TPA: NUDIX hydrolase N-terminal domain-containing protein [Candidatus Dormibacteraeota bacterium]|nr:NUDIX hydrolase N-terminal domain-containing protein [Candidatus Dormibacteraeota bacterium]